MKRLEDMSLEELWQLFPIILEAPNPKWKDWAAEEITFLHSHLNGLITSISHIGSTAIDGIRAKPIIDVLMETDRPEHFAILKDKIIEAGYICMNENETRLDFNKGYTPVEFAEKVFHLHLRITGDNDEIYFRDYLNTHPDVSREYEQLKLGLWKQYEHNRDGYTHAKTAFISRYTSLAKDLFRTHDEV